MTELSSLVSSYRAALAWSPAWTFRRLAGSAPRRGQLAELKQTEIEAEWVTHTLADLDDLWDVLTVENRGRLVRAMVKRIDVDDINGTVAAELVDLSGGDLAGLVDGPGAVAKAPSESGETTEARA